MAMLENLDSLDVDVELIVVDIGRAAISSLFSFVLKPECGLMGGGGRLNERHRKNIGYEQVN